MLNYTNEELEKIKKFAEEQFNHAHETDWAGGYISVHSDEHLMNVINPWIDSSARFELNDEAAIEEWGLELVTEFCESVLNYLK